jgi:hypothetical protein
MTTRVILLHQGIGYQEVTTDDPVYHTYHIDYETVDPQGSMLMVSISGTAVTVR